MAQRSARETALAALRLWRKEKRFADSIISGLLANADLTSSDRAFALELFYGVLRNLTLLDFWIACLRASRIETNVRDILRLGLYQVFLLKTPEHAAVHETVAIAPQKQRSIINAVLRAATRQRSELLAQTDAQPLFVRTSHPQFLVERWQQRFGAEYTEELCKWNNRPAPIYGRINRIKTDPETFLQLYPDSRPLPGNPDFVEFTLCQRPLSILVIATFRTPAQQSRVSFSIRSQEKESSTRVRHRAAKRPISRSSCKTRVLSSPATATVNDSKF